MKYCKLNNLFGKLVWVTWICLSLSKGTVLCSVHHHSTVNMLKRNKPISQFLLKNPEEEQCRFLSFAGTKAAPLREEHHTQEQAVVQERQQHLLQQHTKKEVLTAIRELRKLEAVRAVQCQGRLGPDRDSVIGKQVYWCLTPSQPVQLYQGEDSVNRLMTQHQTKTAKFSALCPITVPPCSAEQWQ